MTRFAAIALATIALAWPMQSSALAALAAGAKTSCKITATNPVQRQIQINCDPTAVERYGITMFYPTEQLSIVRIIGLNGYIISDGQPQEGGMRVHGFYGGERPPTEELDVYGIVFQLNDDLPLDTILNFNVAGPGDFIDAIDIDTGEPRHYSGIYDPATNPDGLRPSFDVGSVAHGSIIPEPTALALVCLPALGLLRRRA